jgi:hypothetical protein
MMELRLKPVSVVPRAAAGRRHVLAAAGLHFHTMFASSTTIAWIFVVRALWPFLLSWGLIVTDTGKQLLVGTFVR